MCVQPDKFIIWLLLKCILYFKCENQHIILTVTTLFFSPFDAVTVYMQATTGLHSKNL